MLRAPVEWLAWIASSFFLAMTVKRRNVVLTPHLAGVHQGECRRMGELMVEELRCYVEGRSLKWAVTKEAFARMA